MLAAGTRTLRRLRCRNVRRTSSDGSAGSSTGPGATPSPPGSLAEAQVELLKARAKATLRRAEAASKEAEARTAAATKRADVEAAAVTKRADVEAVAVTKRADVEAAPATKRIKAEWLRLFAKPVFAGVFAGALAIDWIMHESGDYIKHRMAARLRACPVPDTAQVFPAGGVVLPVQQDPFVLGSLPTMLLGPTGAGKSTLLAAVAREAAAPPGGARLPTPTVLVRVRHSPSVDVKPVSADSKASPLTSAEEAYAHLDATADRLYAQIGFPQRRAVLRYLMNNCELVFKSDFVAVECKAKVVRDRTAVAFRVLFEVCETLCHERVAAGLPLEQAAPVLLFDDVQDLIRDDRMARAGGQFLFLVLAKQLVTYCTDRGVVRAACAGSSPLLSDAFEETSASGFRWFYHELHDPERNTMVKALRERKYKESDAEAMVALCGTRLRPLQGPLTQGPALLSAPAFMDSARDTSHAQYGKVLSRASQEERLKLVGVLDSALRFWDGCAKPGELPPTLGAVFTARHAEAASSLLYVRRDRSITFQSALHAQTWRQERMQLMKSLR